MKRIILTLLTLAMISSVSFSQDTAKKEKPAFYVAGMFAASSGKGVSNIVAPLVEFGVTVKNKTFALDIGRRNLNFSSKDIISNYFWEFRFMPSANVGPLTTFLVFGAGNYFNTKDFFIDYGAGVLLPLKGKNSMFVQGSRADNVNVIAVGFIQGL